MLTSKSKHGQCCCRLRRRRTVAALETLSANRSPPSVFVRNTMDLFIVLFKKLHKHTRSSERWRGVICGLRRGRLGRGRIDLQLLLGARVAGKAPSIVWLCWLGVACRVSCRVLLFFVASPPPLLCPVYAIGFDFERDCSREAGRLFLCVASSVRRCVHSLHGSFLLYGGSCRRVLGGGEVLLKAAVLVYLSLLR